MKQYRKYMEKVRVEQVLTSAEVDEARRLMNHQADVPLEQTLKDIKKCAGVIHADPVARLKVYQASPRLGTLLSIASSVFITKE